MMEAQRALIVHLLSRGETPTRIARDLRISRSVVYSTKKLHDETGGIKKRENGGRPSKIRRGKKQKMTKIIKSNPNVSITELAKRLDVGPSTVARTLKKMGGRPCRLEKNIHPDRENA